VARHGSSGQRSDEAQRFSSHVVCALTSFAHTKSPRKNGGFSSPARMLATGERAKCPEMSGALTHIPTVESIMIWKTAALKR
jgi:hypothetical protein